MDRRSSPSAAPRQPCLRPLPNGGVFNNARGLASRNCFSRLRRVANLSSQLGADGAGAHLRLLNSSHRIDDVDTAAYCLDMPSGRSSSSHSRRATTVAVVEPRPASEAKGSINLRIEAHTRQLIDDAAAVLGKTRTEFMIDSARREAIDVLLDQRLFSLDPERYDAFMQALDNPPAPGPKLKSLLRRVPAWKK